MCVLLLSSGRTPCRGQTAELLHKFSVYVEHQLFIFTANSNCSYLRRTQLFLFTSNSTFFLLRRTQSVLLNSAASLLNFVSGSIYFAYLLREQPRQWPFHQCILTREELCYFVLCTLFKNVTVSCIKSLHYSVDSGLCNSEIPLRKLIL